MADTGVVTTNELLEDPIRDEDQKREIRDDVFTIASVEIGLMERALVKASIASSSLPWSLKALPMLL